MNNGGFEGSRLDCDSQRLGSSPDLCAFDHVVQESSKKPVQMGHVFD